MNAELEKIWIQCIILICYIQKISYSLIRKKIVGLWQQWNPNPDPEKCISFLKSLIWRFMYTTAEKHWISLQMNSSFTFSGKLSLSIVINFLRNPGSESSNFAVAQFGFFWRRIQTAFITVKTSGGGWVYTLNYTEKEHKIYYNQSHSFLPKQPDLHSVIKIQ